MWFSMVLIYRIAIIIGNYLVIAAFIGVVVIAVDHIVLGDIVTDWSCPPSPTGGCMWIDIDRFPGFFGSVAYAFYSASFILPIEDQMAHKSHFSSIITVAFVVVGFSLLAICNLTLYVWGEKIQSIIFLTMENKAIVQALMMIYSFVSISTIPPLIYAPIQICEKYFNLSHEDW